MNINVRKIPYISNSVYPSHIKQKGYLPRSKMSPLSLKRKANHKFLGQNRKGRKLIQVDTTQIRTTRQDHRAIGNLSKNTKAVVVNIKF